MELSRKSRKRDEMKVVAQRIYAVTSLTTAIATLAFCWFKGGPLVFTCGAAMLFFSALLINFLGVRRFVPGLNARQFRAKAVAVFAYMLSAIALIGFVGLYTYP